MPPVLSRAIALVLVGATVLIGACGDDLLIPPKRSDQQLSVLAAGGNEQSGTVGQPLAGALLTRVIDQNGVPAPGEKVAFVLLGDAPGSVVPDTVVTNADGAAACRWILGRGAGQQRIEARLVMPSTAGGTAAVQYTATAGPGSATTLARIAGDNQSAAPGSLLPDSLVVGITDQYGNPVPGIPVAWRVERGGGTISASRVTTGAAGRAAVTWSVGFSLGTQRVSAAVAGLAGSPATFDGQAGF